MPKTFIDFSLHEQPQETDYLVGYNSQTGEEIRIPIPQISHQGESGKSVEIEYSVNGTSWHFPYLNGDKFMRQRVGSTEWSSMIKIACDENYVVVTDLDSVSPHIGLSAYLTTSTRTQEEGLYIYTSNGWRRVALEEGNNISEENNSGTEGETNGGDEPDSPTEGNEGND